MRPNIIYLHSHDTGRYVLPYGHAVPTPNLQALAEGGVLFRQAFCAAPTCSPSRAALLTGQSAHSSGMLGLAHRGFGLSDYDQHLVRTLQGAGYATALAGVQHEAAAADVERIGYDRIVPLASRGSAGISEAAAGFLAGTPAEPFFLAVGFGDTHLAYPEVPEESGRYARPPDPIPDTARTRHMMAAFKESARRLDEGYGRVLQALEDSGLAGNTLVVCTTDHGIAWPGMKCNLTDHGMGVLLILRGPGGFEGGQVCDAMVSHIDVYPTLCDLLEIEPPSWLQGKSMMPLVRGESDQINEAVYGEVTYHAAYEPQRAVRTQRYKYIRRFEERGGPVLPNCDDSLAKEVWLEAGWQERFLDAEQLYDLVFDPNEAHNLAQDPTNAAVLEEMRGRLRQWMTDTGDPLLHGPVAAPSGARVNDPDGASPRDEPGIAP